MYQDSTLQYGRQPHSAIRLKYPELYYRIQPFIMSMIDEMDMNGTTPSQEIIEDMAERIYDEMIRLYPEMADMNDVMETMAQPVGEEADIPVQLGFRRRPSRRRDYLRDIISILLLSELFRRRRY